MKNEKVLGIITNKGGESYKVDIGSSMPASLPFLAFEGATKKNKPLLKVNIFYLYRNSYVCYFIVYIFEIWEMLIEIITNQLN